MRKFIRRPSPALVIAVIALIAATGGNAIASGVTAVAARLGKSSVTSREVKDGSLTLKDFRASDRSRLKGDTGAAGAAGAAGARGATGATGPQGAAGPQGPAGTPDGYTKDEANATFLGRGDKSADADRLDGIDSSGFIQGAGSLTYGHQATTAGGAQPTLLTAGDIAHLNVGCNGSSVPYLFVNSDATNVSYSYTELQSGQSPYVSTDTLPSAGSGSGAHTGAAADATYLVQLWRSSGSGILSTNDIETAVVTASVSGGTCTFTGHDVDGHRNGLVLTTLP